MTLPVEVVEAIKNGRVFQTQVKREVIPEREPQMVQVMDLNKYVKPCSMPAQFGNIDVLKSARKKALDCEKPIIDKELNRLCADEESNKKLNKALAKGVSIIGELDPDFMMMAHRIGSNVAVPKMIPFDLEYGSYFVLSGNNSTGRNIGFCKNLYRDKYNRDYKIDKPIPECLQKYFGFVVNAQTRFIGIIPEKTKAIISQSKKYFDHVFVFSEVPENQWNVDKVTVDPFVVGIIGSRFFLLDHFDTTSLESMIIKEFQKC